MGSENGYQKLPSMLTFKEDICALYKVVPMYLDDNKRATTQIFGRTVEPTLEQMTEVPF